MKRLFMSLTMLVVFLFTSSLFAQEWNKDQLALWNGVEDAWNKWIEKDIDGSLATFHSKYKGWSSDQPVPVDKARIEKWWKSMKEAKIGYLDLIPVSISIVGDAAVVHYYYSFYMTWGEAKEGKERSGRNTEFFIKENGNWMLLGDFTFVDDKK